MLQMESSNRNELTSLSQPLQNSSGEAIVNDENVDKKRKRSAFNSPITPEIIKHQKLEHLNLETPKVPHKTNPQKLAEVLDKNNNKDDIIPSNLTNETHNSARSCYGTTSLT